MGVGLVASVLLGGFRIWGKSHSDDQMSLGRVV